MADEQELLDNPNQQVVREDGSGPGDQKEEKPKRSSDRSKPKAEETEESQ